MHNRTKQKNLSPIYAADSSLGGYQQLYNAHFKKGFGLFRKNNAQRIRFRNLHDLILHINGYHAGYSCARSKNVFVESQFLDCNKERMKEYNDLLNAYKRQCGVKVSNDAEASTSPRPKYLYHYLSKIGVKC